MGSARDVVASVLVALLGVVTLSLLAGAALAVPTVAADSVVLADLAATAVARQPAPGVAPPTRGGGGGRAPDLHPPAGTVQEAPPPPPAPVQPEPVAPGPPAPLPPPPPVPPPATDVVRGVEVLAGLHYPWRDLGFSIVFLPPRRGALGAAFQEERRIEIYVRPEQGRLELAHVIAHEIGHAVDYTYGTPARRAEWMRLRGLDPGWAWAACPGCPDYATPSGDFAEVFAYWLAGPQSGFKGRLAGPPLPPDLDALAAFFWA
jgi:hypothetical protein